MESPEHTKIALQHIFEFKVTIVVAKLRKEAPSKSERNEERYTLADYGLLTLRYLDDLGIR